jgi:hypothetical protein
MSAIERKGLLDFKPEVLIGRDVFRIAIARRTAGCQDSIDAIVPQGGHRHGSCSH